MLDFIRIACAVPAVRVGDTAKNAEDICAYIEKADARQADIVLFPELALTGYSCQDLFFQDALWTGVQQGIRKIAGYTKNYPNVTAVVGLPVRSLCAPHPQSPRHRGAGDGAIQLLPPEHRDRGAQSRRGGL